MGPTQIYKQYVHLIRAVKLIHSFSETCFPSNDFTLLARGTGSLGPCKEYYLAIISLRHDAQIQVLLKLGKSHCVLFH